MGPEAQTTRRALVIDDHADLRLMVRLPLERRGFEVAEAESADDALAAIGQQELHLVVVDQLLGESSTGLELAALASSWRPETQVIVLSAFVSGGRFPGVDAVLSKADISRLTDLADELVPPR